MKQKSKMERTLANERVHQKKNSVTGIKWKENRKREKTREKIIKTILTIQKAQKL